MRARDAHPYVHRALAATGAPADWNDRQKPTWDGARFHFARLKSDSHVLHEIAHWICAPPEARALPNYGLGTDPDDGPETGQDLVPWVSEDGAVNAEAAALILVDLYERDQDGFVALVEYKMSIEESHASIVTVIMLRQAGLPWAATMRRIFGHIADDARRDGFFWGMVGTLAERGVNMEDPLAPFEAARSSRMAG